MSTWIDILICQQHVHSSANLSNHMNFKSLKANSKSRFLCLERFNAAIIETFVGSNHQLGCKIGRFRRWGVSLSKSIVLVFDINVMKVLGLSSKTISKVPNQVLPGSTLTKEAIFEIQTNQKKISKEEKYKEQLKAMRIAEQRYEDQLSKSIRIVEEEL